MNSNRFYHPEPDDEEREIGPNPVDDPELFMKRVNYKARYLELYEWLQLNHNEIIKEYEEDHEA